MRSIEGVLTNRIERWVNAQGGSASRGEAFPIESFPELVAEVAALSFLNKDHLLFFRGQARDFHNKAGASTLYPSIYRGDRTPRASVELAFDLLNSAASRLCEALQDHAVPSHREVRRRRLIQWSILQHYGVCSTPLLDFTQSLLVACSFAYQDESEGDPFVYVVGLPYLTNRVSINSEHDLVNVRLLSICPPEALRPYYQEGYLAGTDEITTEYETKSQLDFNNRLIAKFRLRRHSDFWRGGFRMLPRKALYPKGDPIDAVCQNLRMDLDLRAPDGRVGAFLRSWNEAEARIVTWARADRDQGGVHSIREAISLLQDRGRIAPDVSEDLHALRSLRNEVVHRPERVSSQELLKGTERLHSLMARLGTSDLP